MLKAIITDESTKEPLRKFLAAFVAHIKNFQHQH